MNEWIEIAKYVGAPSVFGFLALKFLIPKMMDHNKDERQKSMEAFERSLKALSNGCEKREERLFNITETLLPELTKSINEMTKIHANHDLMMQGAINDAKRVNQYQQREHEKILALLKDKP